MEISKKKIIVLDLSVIDKTAGATEGEARLRQDILDKIKECKNFSRVVIVGDRELHIRWVVYYVFMYCQVAVSASNDDDLLDNIFRSLPSKLHNKDFILKVGGKALEGVDNISVEDFLQWR